MTEQEILQIICAEVVRLAEEKGETLPTVVADSVFLDGELPMDSLDLATLVVHLENETGFDPFRQGFRQFTTVGELAALYAQ